MSIKSDIWIKEQSSKNDLIHPFQENQVREVDGEKIISYGVSSYGYDVRCADEFKIFTNTFHQLLIQKNSILKVLSISNQTNVSFHQTPLLWQEQ